MAPDDGLVVVLGDTRYRVERPWGRLPSGMTYGVVSQLAVDSQGRVYVFQRDDPPVIVLDPDGNYLRQFGGDIIADAHGIAITRNDEVLLVDRDAHQIVACSPEGEVLYRLGERHRPSLGAPFNHPTDVAEGPDGDLYVSDGYGNSNVHRFGRDGRLKRTWGRPGKGPGEFTTPHAVWVDRRGRVLVADRENDRVQVFDADGGYLTEWGDFYHPMDIWEDAAGMIYVTDQIPRVSMMSPDGRLVGRCRPVLYGAHGIWGDRAGHIYLAETPPMKQVTRLRPIGG
ncbi:MAG TPA: peptidyl-alpha-hydroxyglycine alpha-amidating lyase family protein [Geminicoccaceae bacterium]|nr:peptidyl-alpha-hydroxyglycine alpha-amidating lyase family protein [Geminicoccaceae bacterium]